MQKSEQYEKARVLSPIKSPGPQKYFITSHLKGNNFSISREKIDKKMYKPLNIYFNLK
jgi:hypothetical protein